MILKRTSTALAIAAFILFAAAGLRYAQGLELVDEDTASRTMQIVIGLVLAGYANLMPKDIGRWRSAQAAAASQAVLRVGGWSLTLAGLAYAGIWAFTPIGFAGVAGTIVVAAALVITIGYAARAHAACRKLNGTQAVG